MGFEGGSKRGKSSGPSILIGDSLLLSPEETEEVLDVEVIEDEATEVDEVEEVEPVWE
jgi:hypothetical protein